MFLNVLIYRSFVELLKVSLRNAEMLRNETRFLEFGSKGRFVYKLTFINK